MMKKRNKLKELTISLGIGVFGLIVLLSVSRTAITTYFFEGSTRGEVVDHTITLERPNHYKAGQLTPEKHEILIEYSVNDKKYWALVNSHVFTSMGIIETGDTVLVSYNDNLPEESYVMTGALFSTLASILLPTVILIFVGVTPQWIYQYRKMKRLEQNPKNLAKSAI